MKHLSKILYATGIATTILGFIFVAIAVYGDVPDLQLPGYVLIFLSGAQLVVAFAWDFRQTMLLSETSGDRYNLMSKLALFEEAEQRGLNPKDGKPREYYMTLLREEDERLEEEQQ